MRRTLVRIAHEIVEKNPQGTISIIGIHRRGAILAQRVHALTSELFETPVPLGYVDISFYRDDLAIRPSAPVVHATTLEFPLEGRTIVIVDDVLYTGRTVRAAVDEIFDYGRPARVQLAVLVDRGHRELPIRPDYVGKNIPTSQDQRVNVRVEEVDGIDEVTIGPATERKRRAA
jgi:pyrimidine operon attenuation protein/uracil phosphoribosyltransferase